MRAHTGPTARRGMHAKLLERCHFLRTEHVPFVSRPPTSLPNLTPRAFAE